MPVSFTAFQPAVLKPGWTNGANLKPSCTTASYTGGNPTVATQLKPSICDYQTGNLREGLVVNNALKPSLLR